jgi:Zn-dependent protease
VKEYTRIPRFRICGAPVFVHWSVLLGIGLILLLGFEQPVIALVAVASYLAIIVLHETGHAVVARRVRARPTAIRISLVHGECQHTEPYYEKDDYLIAWGGVAAQLMVATPLILANGIAPFAHIDPFGPIVAYLGYVNIGIAIFNLIPIPGLDGSRAWKLLPVLYHEWREKRRPARRRHF